MTNRFFTPLALKAGEEILLSREETFHLSTVLRKKKNASIELINGMNQLAKGKLLSVIKKQARILVFKVVESQVEYRLILCQGLVSQNKLSWIVEKATELGVTDIRFFHGKKSVGKDLSETGLNRLKQISIAALKQCGRLDLPTIEYFPQLKRTLCEIPSFFGQLKMDLPLLSQENLDKEAAIFIGPEGGFTSEEQIFLEHHKVKPVCLHPYTLRAETAAIASLTMLVQKVMT